VRTRDMVGVDEVGAGRTEGGGRAAEQRRPVRRKRAQSSRGAQPVAIVECRRSRETRDLSLAVVSSDRHQLHLNARRSTDYGKFSVNVKGEEGAEERACVRRSITFDLT